MGEGGDAETDRALRDTKNMHMMTEEAMTATRKYKKIYAWVLHRASKHDTPIPVINKKGAVRWMKL